MVRSPKCRCAAMKYLSQKIQKCEVDDDEQDEDDYSSDSQEQQVVQVEEK